MEQSAFLQDNIFHDLENLNDNFDTEASHFFSETDFEKVLDRAQHFGLGIYTINSWVDGKEFGSASHDEFRKKATDSKWYKKAFLTFRMSKPNLLYSASYKVSKKLLNRGERKTDQNTEHSLDYFDQDS